MIGISGPIDDQVLRPTQSATCGALASAICCKRTRRRTVACPALLVVSAATSLLLLIGCRQQAVEEKSAPPPAVATSDTVTPPPVASTGMPPGPAPGPPSVSDTAGPALGGSSTLRITESARAGQDEIVGVLRVDPAAAYFEDGKRRRLRLIQAPPMTATGSEALMAEAAEALRGFAGQQVRARGDLQGAILWGARIDQAR